MLKAFMLSSSINTRTFRERPDTESKKKFLLYEDMDGTVYDVDLPVTSKVNSVKLRENLGIPEYVDLNYLPMKFAMITLGACMNAPTLHEQYPQAYDKKTSDKLIPA